MLGMVYGVAVAAPALSPGTKPTKQRLLHFAIVVLR